MKTVCFYDPHDLDGRCSGAIVKVALPFCEMISAKYGNMIPLMDDANVIMAGFCIDPFDKMVEYVGKTHGMGGEVHWIDHNEAMIMDYEECGAMISGRRDADFAACELTWMYFRRTPIPKAVSTIGRYRMNRYDDWKVAQFHYGMYLYDSTVKNLDLWNKLLKHDDDTMYEEIVSKSEDGWVKALGDSLQRFLLKEYEQERIGGSPS